MSLESIIVERITQLTALINQMQANAKKTEDFPEQTPINPASKIRVSTNGNPEYTTIQRILDASSQSTGLATTPIEPPDYANITELLANQDNQTRDFIQYVIDASVDPEVPAEDPNKNRFYRYLGTTFGTLADYQMLSNTQANVLLSLNNKLDRGGYGGTAQDLKDLIDGGGVDLSGYMQKSVFDPTAKNADAFNMDNMGESATKKIFTADERAKLLRLGGSTALPIADTGSVLDFTVAKEVLANFGNANTTTEYTIKSGEPILNSSNRILINALTRPKIKGVPEPIGIDNFIPNTDMYMVANYTGTDRGYEYFFLNISGGSVSEFRPLYDRLKEASVSGNYNFVVKDAETWRITMTENTLFTVSDLPPTGFTKTYTVHMTGDFSPTWPASWSANKTGSYIGTTLNTIVVEYVNSTMTKVQITQKD